MRCEACGLIERTDIAVAKDEDRCCCDPQFELVYGRFKSIIRSNDECIEMLTKRLNPSVGCPSEVTT